MGMNADIVVRVLTLLQVGRVIDVAICICVNSVTR